MRISFRPSTCSTPYSIKKLEPFYGFDRTVDLRSASSALAHFEAWLELRGSDEQDDELLAQIEGYNRDDCLSTLRLRDWLESLRDELAEATHAEVPRPAPGDPTPTDSVAEEDEVIAQLSAALTDGVPADPDARTPEEQAQWILAQLLGFHRREQKAGWWEYFRCRDLTDDEMLEDALDRSPKTLPNDAVEVHEHFTAQQTIHLLLARRIATHQFLQRRRFVGREVIDVKVGMGLHPLHHQVDERLEGPFLRLALERPLSDVLPVAIHIPEQVLDAVRQRVRIALQVEKQITGGRERQRGESFALMNGSQQLVLWLPFAAALHLYPRLLADLLDRAAARSLQGRQLGEVHGGQRLHGRDPDLLERPPLRRPDVRDQGEMIHLAPFGIAAHPPRADVAMRNRIRRVRHFRGRMFDMITKPPAQRREVRLIILDPKRDGPRLRPT